MGEPAGDTEIFAGGLEDECSGKDGVFLPGSASFIKSIKSDFQLILDIFR
jgi:hypothetical protein